MPTGRWLTPDTLPAATRCRALFIPDDPNCIAIVTGALELLTYSYNFEQYGTQTPEDTAARFSDMFDSFCFNQGACRVIGEVIAYAGPTSPDSLRWLLCDGSSVLRSDYPDLFAVIGTVYGSVDSTHFNLPDLQGRSPAGVGTGSGLSPVALGDVYGEETHTLTVTEMPSHSHTDTGHIHAESTAVPAIGAAIVGVPVPSAVPGIGVTGTGSAALTSTGGDGAHNTIGPRLGLNFFIVALE